MSLEEVGRLIIKWVATGRSKLQSQERPADSYLLQIMEFSLLTCSHPISPSPVATITHHPRPKSLRRNALVDMSLRVGLPAFEELQSSVQIGNHLLNDPTINRQSIFLASNQRGILEGAIKVAALERKVQGILLRGYLPLHNSI